MNKVLMGFIMSLLVIIITLTTIVCIYPPHGSKGGPAGLSAYQVAVEQGFEGTEEDWLVSLVGPDGLSAYEVALENGFKGTPSQWLASLVGPAGPQGPQGEPGAIVYSQTFDNGSAASALYSFLIANDCLYLDWSPASNVNITVNGIITSTTDGSFVGTTTQNLTLWGSVSPTVYRFYQQSSTPTSVVYQTMLQSGSVTFTMSSPSLNIWLSPSLNNVYSSGNNTMTVYGQGSSLTNSTINGTITAYYI